jgi:hypothetical protein
VSSRYRLIKGNDSGSWLLLTDDGRHLFHLTRYWENGDAEDGATGRPIKGSRWRASLLMDDVGTDTFGRRTITLLERDHDRRIVALDGYLAITRGRWDDWRSCAMTRGELVDELCGYAGRCDCPAPDPGPGFICNICHQVVSRAPQPVERSRCATCGGPIHRFHAVPWLHDDGEPASPHAPTPLPVGALLARRPRS